MIVFHRAYIYNQVLLLLCSCVAAQGVAWNGIILYTLEGPFTEMTAAKIQNSNKILCPTHFHKDLKLIHTCNSMRVYFRGSTWRSPSGYMFTSWCAWSRASWRIMWSTRSIMWCTGSITWYTSSIMWSSNIITGGGYLTTRWVHLIKPLHYSC